MSQTIKFKPYYNNDNFTYDELPQFILNEKKFELFSFNTKLLFFAFHNKSISKLTTHFLETDGYVYFSFTHKDMMKATNLSKNTIKACKKVLIDNQLIIELPRSKGRKTSVYRINKKVELESPNARYVNQEGEIKFTFIKVPHFLDHRHFEKFTWESKFIYATIRHQMNISLKNAEQGNRSFVDAKSNVFCQINDNKLRQKLNLSSDTLRKHKQNLLLYSLLKEKTTYINNKSIINYYVYEPIALPVETKNNDKSTKHVLTIRTAKYDNMRLFRAPSNKNKNCDEVKNNSLKGQISTDKGSNSSRLMGQNFGTNELQLKELQERAVNELNEVNNQTTDHTNHNSEVIEYNNFKKQQLVKYLPDYLSSYLINFDEKDIVLIKDNLFTAKKSYFNDIDILTTKGTLIPRDILIEFSIEHLQVELRDVLKRIKGKSIKDKESVLEMSETGFLFTCIKNVFIQAYDDFYNSKNAFKYNLSYAKKFLENMKKIENKLQYQAKNNENNFYGKKVDATEAELDALGIG